MLSAFILSVLSYPAVALAGQLVHQWYVHPGPLVLRTALFKFPTPTTDRDQTVSRRFEPSFVPDRVVSLSVKLPSAFTLFK